MKDQVFRQGVSNKEDFFDQSEGRRDDLPGPFRECHRIGMVAGSACRSKGEESSPSGTGTLRALAVADSHGSVEELCSPKLSSQAGTAGFD